MADDNLYLYEVYAGKSKRSFWDKLIGREAKPSPLCVNKIDSECIEATVTKSLVRDSCRPSLYLSTDNDDFTYVPIGCSSPPRVDIGEFVKIFPTGRGKDIKDNGYRFFGALQVFDQSGAHLFNYECSSSAIVDGRETAVIYKLLTEVEAQKLKDSNADDSLETQFESKLYLGL